MKSFITPIAKAVKVVDHMSDLVKVFEELKKKEVLVGIPEEKASRKGGGINNAELAFIHSKGSPLNGIPPRPFLEPAIQAHAEEIAKQQMVILQAALNGDRAKMDAELIRLGVMGQSFAKAWFRDPRNGWAPNTPETIYRKNKTAFDKLNRNKKISASDYQDRFNSIIGNDKPLIDTGQLRNSITYVVRDTNSHA